MSDDIFTIFFIGAYVLFLLVPISVVARIIASTFSSKVREEIKAYPKLNVLWFVTGLICFSFIIWISGGILGNRHYEN